MKTYYYFTLHYNDEESHFFISDSIEMRDATLETVSSLNAQIQQTLTTIGRIDSASATQAGLAILAGFADVDRQFYNDGSDDISMD